MNEQEPSGKPSIFGTQEAAAAEAPSEHESATASTSAPPRDLDNDLLSVLLAASSPLTLLAIQDELNVEGREYIAAGPINRLLDDWAGGDRPRVVVTKLGDPMVEHYRLSLTYRTDVESPDLVIERRSHLLGAIILPWACDEDAELDENSGCTFNELNDLLNPDLTDEGIVTLRDDLDRLVGAGALIVLDGERTIQGEDSISAKRYVMPKAIVDRFLREGAPAIAKLTLPKQTDESEQPGAADAALQIDEYIALLNARLEEQTKRAEHFQSEAFRFAKQATTYEAWARKGGFNIAEIVATPPDPTSGNGVPWVVLRMVNETELRRLIHEEDRLNEALASAKKTFESDKNAYAAIKSKLEERLAIVKQAQRSSSYMPDKFVHRIARDGRVEVVSADEHDKGDHLEWEELPRAKEEPEREVVTPTRSVIFGGVGVHAGVTSTVVFGQGQVRGGLSVTDGAPVVQVSRREDGTTSSTFAGSVPGPVAPAEDRRVPDGKQYAGKLGPADLADAMTATFLNEEWGIRRNDVQAHFEAIHGALPEGGEKAIGPALRLLEGRGALLAGDVPGSSSTAEPTRLYWHVSFKDPRTAPPPAPLEPAPKPARKVKEKAVKAPAADDAPKVQAKTKEPAKASKRAKKAASK